MARRPAEVDPETWREQRSAYWRKVNRMWTVLMIIACALVLARYFGWLPALR
ncbi:MAG TPA: hypothetical protein VEI82_00765 [Myxococcota bacterium]|nr:hypothetical protein [Myxococcota bacterium]